MPVPTIVLLHGQPDSSASFWPLRRELLRRLPSGVRVLAPDRPGYGANPLPAAGYPGNARWLQDWLERVEAGPVVLVGHSWAGGVAILTAARRPPELVGLVLLGSVGPDCLVRTDPVLAAPVVGELIAFTTLQLGRPLVRWRTRSAVLGALAEPDRPYGSSSGAAMRYRPVWRSFLHEQRALLAELPRINAALPLITAPTMVISGDRDSMIPSETPPGLLAAIGQSSGHQVAGGHDLQLGQAAEVAELIAGRFGAALDPASARAGNAASARAGNAARVPAPEPALGAVSAPAVEPAAEPAGPAGDGPA